VILVPWRQGLVASLLLRKMEFVRRRSNNATHVYILTYTKAMPHNRHWERFVQQSLFVDSTDFGCFSTIVIFYITGFFNFTRLRLPPGRLLAHKTGFLLGGMDILRNFFLTVVESTLKK
jgi:hypothetical protein